MVNRPDSELPFRDVFLLRKNSLAFAPFGSQKSSTMNPSHLKKSEDKYSAKNFIKRKGGRPRQIVKRDRTVGVRLTALEREVIQLAADRSGLTLTSFMRKSALNKEIKFRINPEELEVFQLLTEYRVNFTRISNLISQRPDLADLRAEVQQVARTIEKQLTKFR